MRIGQTVSHYLIEARLGRGGMGEVFRARDTRLDRYVALKVLSDSLDLPSEARLRFESEAKAASALDHPNICTVHDVGETPDGRPFFAMACYDGETLSSRLEQGSLPVDEAVRYAIQIAEGLGSAHEAGIVHRDVKPANIMITGGGLVKLLDFGIAKMATSAITRAGTSFGTVAYMSPEQALGKEVDSRTDIWSLGALLYEMLAGERPFPGEYDQAVIYGILNADPEPLSHLRQDVPEPLARLVHLLLEKDRENRPAKAEAVATALREGTATATPAAGDSTKHASPMPSLAVLPFADMSPGQDQAYFCEGIAEEIITALARVKNLHVASRTSSFVFRDGNADVREIGRQLEVNSVLEGSVRKAGNRLRVTVQLVDTTSGFQLWSERYDGSLEDVFAVQDEIAGNTVRALRGILTEEDEAAIRKQPVADVGAYEFYLQGRYFLHQGNRTALDRARRLFGRAILIDRNFASAHAGLAYASFMAYRWFGRTESDAVDADRFSRRAVELAPNLAESHVARGLALGLKGRYREAEQAMEEALRLNPESYEANYYFGRLCFWQGKHEQAAALFEQAARLDPQEYQASCLLIMPYEALGRDVKAQAIEALHRVEQRLSLDPEDVRAMNLGAGAWAQLDNHERAIEWTRRALNMAPEDAGVVWNAACTYARSGMIDEALDCLERAVGLGIAHREWAENDTDLDPLRDHPRYHAALEAMGKRDGSAD